MGIDSLPHFVYDFLRKIFLMKKFPQSAPLIEEFTYASKIKNNH